ncbi:MAG: periplasmic protein TonB [Blastocatellia bacterium]|nr:periplasmic protein TonB [Blastocatellia bacterium]
MRRVERLRELLIRNHFSKEFAKVFATAVLIAFVCATGLSQATSSVAPQPDDAGILQSKIMRAKALAAAHNLDSAAVELNSILSAAKEDSVRDVARILLMDVYLEQADYTKAQGLLEDTFTSQAAKGATSTGNYFALAGQTVNGAREHIARYRSFGINVLDANLPAEALNDLNKLRILLEKVDDQANQLSSDNERATDAIGLIEDVAAVRMSMSRDAPERERWRREFESAREKLAANDNRMANATAASRGPQGVQTAPPPQSNAKVPVVPASASRDQPKEVSPSGGTASTAPASSGFVEVGLLTDKATHTAKPTYPQAAKVAKVGGDVTVFLQVDETGAVSKIDHSTGPKLLQGAAEDASKQWKFRPTVVDGQPVKVTGFITFKFNLVQ